MTAEERDAARLADRVQRFWRDQGYPSVSCEVVKGTALAGGPVSYEVRCNLVNGLPPDFRAEDVHRLRNAG